MQRPNIYRPSLLPFKAALLILGIVLYRAAVFAQTGSGEQGIPIQRDFLPTEYRADQQNFAITTDKRGVIYVANFAGVLEYDGSEWRTILTAERSKVNALATDATGKIYVGTRSEAGYLTPDAKGGMVFKSFKSELAKLGVVSPNVINCFASPQGVWFVAAHHVMLYGGGKFKVDKIGGDIQNSFYVNGKLYLYLKSAGLKVFEQGRLSDATERLVFSDQVTVNTMIALDDRNLMIASNLGLYLLQGKTITKLNANADKFFADNIASSSTLLKDGHIAFGTLKGGIAIVDRLGNIVQQYNKTASGLYSNGINYLYMDDSNGLWVAMQNGITRINMPSALSIFNSLKKVSGNVNSITRYKGNIHIATDQGVLVYNRASAQFGPITGLGMSAYHLLVHNDKLMVATALGVYSYDGTRAVKLNEAYSLCLFADGADVYAGRLSGVAKISNGRTRRAETLKGISDEIRAIAKDADGNLWLQTPSNGLIRYEPASGSYTRYTAEKGGLPFNTGNTINPTSGGILVGTLKGVFVYNKAGDSFKKQDLISNATALNKDWVNKIAEDKNGNLFVTAGDGSHVSLLRRSAEGKYQPDNAGLLPIRDEQLFSIYPDSVTGNVWMGGAGELIKFDSHIVTRSAQVRHTLIRTVILNTEDTLFKGSYFDARYVVGYQQNDDLKKSLNYKQNNLYFNFSAPLSSGKDGVTFQYMLEGFETDSAKWDDEPEKEYSNLPPGIYTFHVRSKDLYGVVSPEATYSFSIQKPYYQTVTAYVIYLLLLGGAVLLFVKIRSAQLLKEKKKLEDLIQQRTEEVVHQKEEIESQSAELAHKNDELEKINLIVRSINAEIDFESLMQTILEKTRVIRGAEKAAMLVFDHTAKQFRFKASFGYDVAVLDTLQLTPNEAETRYLSDAEEVYEDIFFVRSVKSIHKDKEFSQVNKAKSVLILVIRLHGNIEAFLILENWQKQNAFTERDFSLLRNLKEHFIAAFIKTNLLEEVQDALTDLKATQEQLIRHEKQKSVGDLTKGLVDRILNPLNYINNFSLLSKKMVDETQELITLPEPTADDKQDAVDILDDIRQNLQKVNDHGSNVSKMLKSMERILKERSTTFIDTDINKLVSTNIDTAVADARKEYPENTIEVIRQLDPKEKKTAVLPYELSTVILHLFSNAVYTVMEKVKPNSQFKPQITVTTVFDKDNFTISVHDNGKGILPTELKLLFSPFTTTKPTAKGTGLGLYLSQDLVKEHNGSITVETKEGEFTKFTLTIPYKNLRS